MRRGLRPVAAALMTGVVVCVLGGCGLSARRSRAGPATPPTAAAGTTAPALADVTPLSDVRDWDGEVGRRRRHPGRPGRRSPSPQLPVTVTDAQGTEVTVTDTSRVLALDVYGTLARTVFELGLGDHLVGRDISTEFAEAAGPAAGHPERPRASTPRRSSGSTRP